METTQMQETLATVLEWLPKQATVLEIERAMCYYDGDNSKPYCDLVYAGLDIIRKLLKLRNAPDVG